MRSLKKLCLHRSAARAQITRSARQFSSPQGGLSSNFAPGAILGLAIGVGLGYVVFPIAIRGIQDFNEKQDALQEMQDKHFSYRDLFDKYASVEKDGVKYLTQRAFIEALVLPRPRTPSWVAHRRTGGKLSVDHDVENDPALKTLLSVADSDGDGLYSYAEFCLFLTLLACDETQFVNTFKMFDLDGNGSVDRSEFAQFIRANQQQTLHMQGPDTPPDDNNNGFIRHFFNDPNKKLSYQEFSDFVKSLKQEILRQEFNIRDVERKGLISIESFSDLVANSVHFNSIRITGFKTQLALLKTRGFFMPSGKVDFETFKAFHLMSTNLDQISTAAKLHAASGNPLDKRAFKRALSKVAGIEISDRTVDLVFALFDKNQSGTLDFAEFADALHNRAAGDMRQVPLKI